VPLVGDGPLRGAAALGHESTTSIDPRTRSRQPAPFRPPDSQSAATDSLSVRRRAARSASWA